MVIWLPTPIVFWLGEGTVSLSCSIYSVSEVRQTEIHTAEALVHEPSVFEFEMAIEMLKGHN